MRDFACPDCGQRRAFENPVCLSCSNGTGFDLDLDRVEFAQVDRDGCTLTLLNRSTSHHDRYPLVRGATPAPT